MSGASSNALTTPPPLVSFEQQQQQQQSILMQQIQQQVAVVIHVAWSPEIVVRCLLPLDDQSVEEWIWNFLQRLPLESWIHLSQQRQQQQLNISSNDTNQSSSPTFRLHCGPHFLVDVQLKESSTSPTKDDSTLNALIATVALRSKLRTTATAQNYPYPYYSPASGGAGGSNYNDAAMFSPAPTTVTSSSDWAYWNPTDPISQLASTFIPSMQTPTTPYSFQSPSGHRSDRYGVGYGDDIDDQLQHLELVILPVPSLSSSYGTENDLYQSNGHRSTWYVAEPTTHAITTLRIASLDFSTDHSVVIRNNNKRQRETDETDEADDSDEIQDDDDDVADEQPPVKRVRLDNSPQKPNGETNGATAPKSKRKSLSITPPTKRQKHEEPSNHLDNHDTQSRENGYKEEADKETEDGIDENVEAQEEDIDKESDDDDQDDEATDDKDEEEEKEATIENEGDEENNDDEGGVTLLSNFMTQQEVADADTSGETDILTITQKPDDGLTQVVDVHDEQDGGDDGGSSNGGDEEEGVEDQSSEASSVSDDEDVGDQASDSSSSSSESGDKEENLEQGEQGSNQSPRSSSKAGTLPNVSSKAKKNVVKVQSAHDGDENVCLHEQQHQTETVPETLAQIAKQDVGAPQLQGLGRSEAETISENDQEVHDDSSSAVSSTSSEGSASENLDQAGQPIQKAEDHKTLGAETKPCTESVDAAAQVATVVDGTMAEGLDEKHENQDKDDEQSVSSSSSEASSSSSSRKSQSSASSTRSTSTPKIVQNGDNDKTETTGAGKPSAGGLETLPDSPGEGVCKSDTTMTKATAHSNHAGGQQDDEAYSVGGGPVSTSSTSSSSTSDSSSTSTSSSTSSGSSADSKAQKSVVDVVMGNNPSVATPDRQVTNTKQTNTVVQEFPATSIEVPTNSQINGGVAAQKNAENHKSIESTASGESSTSTSSSDSTSDDDDSSTTSSSDSSSSDSASTTTSSSSSSSSSASSSSSTSSSSGSSTSQPTQKTTNHKDGGVEGGQNQTSLNDNANAATTPVVLQRSTALQQQQTPSSQQQNPTPKRRPLLASNRPIIIDPFVRR